uniref:Uncharacterized protein n=1 Tax=Romanomermis culicivorax TaxID=13658 RepID=A0A915L6K2_ROMCU
MEPELVADLVRRFRETFEDKYTDQQWKGAYDVEEMTNNIKALYFMMRGETIATYKLSEEQAPRTFYCPPHFSNSDIEPQPVPSGWYPWVERKVKAQRKRKSTDDSEDEPSNNWDLEDILAAPQFGQPIEPKQVEMKQGKWPKGVLQFTNNIRDQVLHLRDYYHPRINRSILPIVKELYDKDVNPIVYFLWPHLAQEWKAWIPGFTSGMWSSVWRNKQERIEFMKRVGQDLLNNKITDQMEQMLERYPKRHEKSMSREKRRRENDEESEKRWQKEIEKYEGSRETKQEEKRDTKEHKD